MKMVCLCVVWLALLSFEIPSQLQHALYGVEQGRKTSATGAPIEIMGLCVGHIDPKDPSAFILTDVSVERCTNFPAQ